MNRLELTEIQTILNIPGYTKRSREKMKRAVFLDRGGVITQAPLHYAHRIDQLAIIPRSSEGIRLLNEYGLPVCR